MTKTHDISELVSRAQKGDRESLGVMSAHVRQRVFVYLYRMTLDYHLAEDLVQETVLYMIESLPRLKTASSSSLWAWVYRSAWGKFQHHLRPQGHQRIVQKTIVDHEALLQMTDETKDSALEQAERAELFEAICKSLGALQTRHRNVLVLRCFELLSYAEIASVMGGSELKARVLFFHAKHALKRHLHNRGYGRQYFLTSLSLFGLITGMRTQSTSAAITVTSNLLKGNTIATTIGAVTTKLGLITTAIVTTGLTVGTLYVCSSDTDMPTESTINVVTRGAENAFTMAEKMGNTEIADLLSKKSATDPVLSDRHGDELYESEGMLPPGPGDRPRPGMPASVAQPVVQVDLLADPNEIKTRVKSFAGLEKAIQDVEAKSASEQRYWAQTKYDNRRSLARAVQKQVEDELALVRQIAVEEKATKTTEAIDVLVTKEKDRYKMVSRELLQQLREAMAAQGSRGAGRTRGSTRSSRRGYSSGYGPYGDTGGMGTAGRGRYGRSSARAEEPLDRETQEEICQWTQATVNNKSDLARTTHDQIYGEMALIRGVAAEEEAKKTTAAIDGLLLARKERLGAYMKKAEEERSRLLPGQDPAPGRYRDQSMQSGRRRRR